MESKPGTYVLILRCRKGARVQVGKWGLLYVRRGYYAYVGSAFGPGGVLARVSRHCRPARSKHWHIDFLREHGTLEAVWYNHSTTRYEHAWAGVVARMPYAEEIPGFGCSDCNCASHLYRFASEPALKDFAAATPAPVKSWTCGTDRGR